MTLLSIYSCSFEHCQLRLHVFIHLHAVAITKNTDQFLLNDPKLNPKFQAPLKIR